MMTSRFSVAFAALQAALTMPSYLPWPRYFFQDARLRLLLGRPEPIDVRCLIRTGRIISFTVFAITFLSAGRAARRAAVSS